MGWPVLLMVALTLTCAVGIFTLTTREFVGLAALAMTLVLMFMKLPVAFALTAPAVLGLYSLAGPRAVESVFASTPMAATASWTLSVLPMFILMGGVLASSGITGRVYETARIWLNRVPGGLAVGTTFAGAGLASVSGSTIGNSYALGRVGIPEMLRRGYSPRLAVGSVIASGLPGQVIPPSTFLVVVAGITGAAVGPQLIAGVIPGALMVLIFAVTIMLCSACWPALIGKGTTTSAQPREHFTWRVRFGSLLNVVPLLILFAGIFGGMFSGTLTATEAGAAGAFLAILLTIWYTRKSKPLMHVWKGINDTVAAVGAIFLLIVGAHVLTQFVAVSGLGRLFADAVIDLNLNKTAFLLVVMLGYLILGMFMDPLAMLLLTIPILQPTLVMMEVDLLWFGVFAVVMGELAIITPPIGVLTFIMHKMTRDPSVNLGHEISLKDVFVGVGWFVPSTLILVVILIAFPDLATWLPSQMGT